MHWILCHLLHCAGARLPMGLSAPKTLPSHTVLRTGQLLPSLLSLLFPDMSAGVTRQEAL